MQHGQAEVPALEVPQRHIDGAQCLDGQPLLAMITQPVVEILPMKLGREPIRTKEKRLVEIDDWRG